MTSIKIGTRGSALALKQTEMVIEEIKKAFPDIKTEVIVLKTTGDKITDKPLYAIGGKGLFVNEFEDALLKGEMCIRDRIIPTFMPSFLASLTASRQTLAIVPKATTIMSASAVSTSSHLCSFSLISAYLA